MTTQYFLYHVKDNCFIEVSESEFRNWPKWSNGNRVCAFNPGEQAFWQFDVQLGGAFGVEIDALNRLVTKIQKKVDEEAKETETSYEPPPKGFEHDFNYRLKMVEECGRFEGTEIADGILSAVDTAQMFRKVNHQHAASLVLLAAEQVCKDFVAEFEYNCSRSGNYDEYVRMPTNIYRHFMDGKQPMTAEEFEA